MDYKKIMDSLFKENFELEKQRDQYKTERDTLIDDIAVLKANISRLERENEKLGKANSSGWKQKDEIANKLISDIKCKNNLLSEISKHISNKPSSSTYKYFRAKLDSIGIKEGE